MVEVKILTESRAEVIEEWDLVKFKFLRSCGLQLQNRLSPTIDLARYLDNTCEPMTD